MNLYVPGPGAVNPIVSDVPGATIVDVATFIGSPRVRLWGTVAWFSKTSRTCAPALTSISPGTNFSSLPVSVPMVTSTPVAVPDCVVPGATEADAGADAEADGRAAVAAVLAGGESVRAGGAVAAGDGVAAVPHAPMMRASATTTVRIRDMARLSLGVG